MRGAGEIDVMRKQYKKWLDGTEEIEEPHNEKEESREENNHKKEAYEERRRYSKYRPEEEVADNPYEA